MASFMIVIGILFAGIGYFYITSNQEFSSLSQTISSQSQQIAERNALINRANAQIANNTLVITADGLKITNLTSSLRVDEAKIADLLPEVANYTQVIARLYQEDKNSSGIISNLQQELATAEGQLEALQSQVSGFESQISILQVQVTSLQQLDGLVNSALELNSTKVLFSNVKISVAAGASQNFSVAGEPVGVILVSISGASSNETTVTFPGNVSFNVGGAGVAAYAYQGNEAPDHQVYVSDANKMALTATVSVWFFSA
jgi:predicted  nucleic acid-binding Zn-ribbon protein